MPFNYLHVDPSNIPNANKKNQEFLSFLWKTFMYERFKNIRNGKAYRSSGMSEWGKHRVEVIFTLARLIFDPGYRVYDAALVAPRCAGSIKILSVNVMRSKQEEILSPWGS
jgi:hypothetical protein